LNVLGAAFSPDDLFFLQSSMGMAEFFVGDVDPAMAAGRRERFGGRGGGWPGYGGGQDGEGAGVSFVEEDDCFHRDVGGGDDGELVPGCCGPKE
jgi:hypothetical protein